jgi:hypothetical protein
MNTREYLGLRNNLNDFVGSGYAYVPAWAPIIYGEVDRPGQWAFVHATLSKWEAKGFLKVLKNPEHCTADELCIEMLNFIDAEKPLPPDWTPSKTRIPPKWPHPYKPGTIINRGHSIGDKGFVP